jgi:hypothetical protein
MFSRDSSSRRRRRGKRGPRTGVTVILPAALIVAVGVPLALFAGRGSAGSGGSAAGASAVNASSANATPRTVRQATVPIANAPRAKVAPDAYSSGPTAQTPLGGLATKPVDGTGAPISLNQTPAQAAASGNCTLVVPAHPLTAVGLATPYQLGDGCSEANPNLQAFAEATILLPTGEVLVYSPLVITAGTTPASRPIPPTIPQGSVVILDFGSNSTNLVLTGPGAREPGSGCVDALGQSLIGQVSACNAVPFYKVANAEIAAGSLRVPSAGMSLDGEPCQDSRNFALVDQDPSDNTYTQYLLNDDGQTAQATPANRAAMGGAGVIDNGSDNALLGYFVDPANGCHPFAMPDPTSANSVQSSQALDELSARVNQHTPIGLVPPNDEMVLVDSDYNVAKTNVYRSLVDQPLLPSNANAIEVAAAFCMNMVNVAAPHDQVDMARDTNFTSAVPAVGDNLATFLGNRLSLSFANLDCPSFGLKDPVNVTTDGNGVATEVSYDTAHQQATIPAEDLGTGATGGGAGKGRMVQNPSGE